MPKQTFFNLPDNKRQAILDLAIEEFAQHDYRNASISKIVARAGIAKGSFYQYFEDKQDLYLYLIELMVEEKKRFFADNPPPAEQNTGVFDWLRWMFQAGLQFQFSNPQLAQIGVRSVYGDAPLPSDLNTAVESSGQAFYRSLVEQGIAQGDIDPNLDPELVVYVFDTLMTHFGDYLLRRLDVSTTSLAEQGGRALDKPEFGTLVTNLITILERGLEPQNRRDTDPTRG